MGRRAACTQMTRSDGIHTLADLLGRCRRDDETGCMVLSSPKNRGTHYVWLPVLSRPVALPTVLAILMGKELVEGQKLVPRCGNTSCCEPSHRFVGTRSDLMRILRPQLEPIHRAKIAIGHRSRSRYCPELCAEIMSSEESGAAIARRIGMHVSHVCRIRRGEAWRDSAPTASVFSLGATR